MILIKDYIQKLTPISDEDWEIFSTKFEKQIIKKNSPIIISGEVENYLYFIETGIVRFWIVVGDNEVTFDFAFEKSFFSAYLSFLTREPTNWNIQTLTGYANKKQREIKVIKVEANESENRKRSSGRPKKAILKTEILMVRMTSTERVLMESKAKKEGMNPREWFC